MSTLKLLLVNHNCQRSNINGRRITLSCSKEAFPLDYTITYQHQEIVTNWHRYNCSAQVMLPLRCKLPNSQHNDGFIKHWAILCLSCYLWECVLMKRWFWGEPSTPLITWQQKHMPSACAGLPASALCPALCQLCHWDAGWKGETVWHCEDLRITGCLIITSSGQERVDISLTI